LPKTRLRFTKTGNRELEVAYATHFVGRGRETVHWSAPDEGHYGLKEGLDNQEA
jgi:hypothetical protein